MGKKLYTLGFLCGCLLLLVTPARALNYYWVGGTGNWSQYASHWATTSGGSTFHTQVPQSVDNVFFDANSFTAGSQSVTIDQTIVNCNSMNWTGVANSPALNGPGSNTLYIYGSLTFVPGMVNNFRGQVYFQATTTGHTIAAGSQVFNNYLYFNGDGGGWTLQDSLTVKDALGQASISLVYGSLNTNSQNVRTGGFVFGNYSSRPTITLGASVITVTGSNCRWNVGNGGLDVSAGTSHLLFPDGTQFTGGAQTYYNVTFTGPSAAINDGNTFHDVLMDCSGYINSSCTFNNLTFTAGHVYNIGGTQSVLNSFTAVGNCSALVFIKAQGNNTTFQKTSGSVTLDHVYLQGIKASGGASFVANGSVDGGGNTGWTINALTPTNLYWVGGTGNWSDGNHWSNTSGGTGTGCVPTPADNVFFDANSFPAAGQTVMVDVTNVYCRDMDWTGANNPVFQNATYGYTLQLYGSLTLTASMTNNFAGQVNFLATSTGKTITSAGQGLAGNAVFEGIGGGWTLQDSMAVKGGITLNFGTLNTNNQSLYTKNGMFLAGNGNSSCTFNMGSSRIYIGTGGASQISSWTVYSSGLTLNAGTSTIIFNDNANFTGGGLTYHDIYFNYGASYYFQAYATFNDVYIKGSTNIQGNNTFQNLTLYSGYTYMFRSNSTTTIGNSLNASGSCNGTIFIQVIETGSQATIKKLSGSVDLDFVFLRDIKATGGATFTATNSTDGGNNTGWTITTATTKNLYWIGGTGNWSDVNHWSLTSGGAPSGCLPTLVDNVYFDANSFSATAQTVTVDINSAYCRDMDWTGAAYNPTLAGTAVYGKTLNIYGSLTFIPAMSLSYANPVSFKAAVAGKIITTAGIKFKENVIFDGVGGEWTLQDELTLLQSANYAGQGRIECNNGTLNSNNKNITALAFYGNGGKLILGSSVVTLSYGGGQAWGARVGFQLDAGTSSMVFTGNGGYMQFYYYRFGVGPLLNYYDVSFTGSSETVQVIGNSTFHSLSFNGNVQLNDSLTVGSLNFNNPGRTVTVAAGSTQYITNSLYAVGTGSFPIRIQSSAAGSQHTFYKADGTVCMDYVRISDSKATGGASFNAGANSQDLGGNTGWNFSGGSGSVSVNITSSQPDTICPGTPVTYTATSNAGGTPTYIWLVNGNIKQTGTSDTYTASTLTNGDTVYCKVNVSALCFGATEYTSNRKRITVQPGAVAGSITALHGSVCQGHMDTLSAVGNNSGIQWQSSIDSIGYNDIPGAVNAEYRAQPAQTTFYRLIAGSGLCADTSAVLKLIVKEFPPTPVATLTDAIICSGDSTQVCATTGYSAYRWNTGATTQCIYATAAGGYWVTGTGANGCRAASGHATLDIYAVPTVAVIVKNDTLTSFGASSYQWLDGDNNPIPGATDSVYVTKQSGFYTVQITDANGCKATATPVYIGITGVDALLKDELRVYPNPANDYLMIKHNGVGVLNIYSSIGQRMYSGKHSSHEAIPVSHFPAGIYYLSLLVDGQLEKEKIIVEHK